MLFLSIALLTSHLPDAPVPIAAGSLQSIFEVLAAAKSCNVGDLRISLYEHSRFGEARLYLIGSVDVEAETCLMTWVSRNRERLKLIGS